MNSRFLLFSIVSVVTCIMSAGCIFEGGRSELDAPEETSLQKAFLYVVNFTSSEILRYAIGTTNGMLSDMTSVANGDNAPTAVAFDPKGQYAYVSGFDGYISQYAVGADGEFSAMNPPIVATGGVMSQIPPGSKHLGKASFIVVDPSGRYAYATSYDSSTISQYKIVDGRLFPMEPATIATGERPYWMAIDPSGHYAYVTQPDGSSISQYAIGMNDGRLSEMKPATISVDAIPYVIAVHPSGKYAYIPVGHGIAQYNIDKDSGSLSVAPVAMSPGDAYTTQITIDSFGEHAYAVDQKGYIWPYAIGTDGKLSLTMSPLPVTMEASSSVNTSVFGRAAVTIDPSGRYVYVMFKGGIAQYKIKGGKLLPMNPATVGGDPDGGSFFLTVSAVGKS